MKTIQITKPGTVKVVEKSVPEPNRGEVLLRIKKVGLCGSDLSTYLGKNPLVTYPRVPGHEVSAIIVKSGDEVPDNFIPGQLVTVVPYTNCGQCSSCRQKRYNACQYNETLGVQRDGAIAEYITVPWQKLIVDDDLSTTELALVEPLTVGFHAIDRAGVKDNEFVMVLGCGMIGNGAIIRSSVRGAKVIAVDIDDDKLDIARELGARYTINTRKEQFHEKLLSITDGHGPEVVVEAAGNPVTYKLAINEVAFAGRVVCIGYAAKEIEFATKLWVQKELSILGSRNASPLDFEAVVNYLKEKSLNTSKLVTKIVGIEDVPDAIKAWSEHPEKIMKIMVEFE